MSRHDRQLAKQRADFLTVLKRSRCPKCGARVLEISQPEVLCENCNTQFVLAIQSGFAFLRSKLVEKQALQSPRQQKEQEQEASSAAAASSDISASDDENTSTSSCPSCGVLVSQDSLFCNKCGTKL